MSRVVVIEEVLENFARVQPPDTLSMDSGWAVPGADSRWQTDRLDF